MGARESTINRRDVLRAAGVGAVAIAAQSFLTGWVAAEEAKTRKILFYTRSQGFPHGVITRKDPEKLSFAEQIAVDMGKKNGFEVTATKDGSIFTPEKLAEFDVVMFYTTGDLTNASGPDKFPPMPKEGKQALFDFVSGGKGFVGMHCASDTFHGGKGKDADPYIKMLGGEFDGHGGQQKSLIKVVDPNFNKGFEDYEMTEEWYRFKNFAPDLHVILLQQTDTMSEKAYKDQKPYPETWARMQGKGRVFYTSMGHRDDVWQSEAFHKVLLSGLAWTSGNVEHDVAPNLEQVAPGAMDRLSV